MKVALLTYNNYFNKQKLAPKSHLNAYPTPSLVQENIQFNPNDEINTELILNGFENINADYLLVCDDEGNVISRWFVLDCERTVIGQGKYKLFRDAVADNYNAVLNATTFIQKATITEKFSPFLYHKEGFSVNQIKQSETPLYDATGTPWIIGFVQRVAEIATEVSYADQGKYDLEVANILTWQYHGYENTAWMGNAHITSLQLEISADDGLNTDTSIIKILPYQSVASPVQTPNPLNSTNYTTKSAKEVAKLATENASQQVTLAVNQFTSIYGTYHSDKETSDLLGLNGKIVRDAATGTNYRINVIKDVFHTNAFIKSSAATGTRTATLTVLNALQLQNTAVTDLCGANYSYRDYYIKLEEVTTTDSVIISGNRRKLEEYPYDMFALPYNTIKLIPNGGSAPTITSYGNVCRGIAGSMAYQFGGTSGFIYDIQVCPYCPLNLTDVLDPQGNINLNKLVAAKDYNLIQTDSAQVTGIMFWLTQNQGSNYIASTVAQMNTALDSKVSNECDLYRITSGNYNNSFEFNAARNGGIQGLYADYTYLPYKSYIRVYPRWKHLYGEQDFSDTRGLVFTAETFNIINDNWINYQIQNKTYQQQFNRSIESLDKEQSIQRQEALWGLASGSLTGISTGAAMGSLLGGPIGGIAGGAIGGLGSIGTGVIDYSNLIKRQTEAKSYQTDMYNYNLADIQARPDSLGQITSITINNKLIPVIEYWTCTELEKEAFKEKLKYNGMTVGVIGTVRDYQLPQLSFIQGQIIRFNDTVGDNHMAQTIADELQGGIFI